MKTREAYNVIVKRIEAKTRVFNKQICLTLVGSVIGLIIYVIFATLFIGGLPGEDNAMFLIPLIVFAIFAFFRTFQLEGFHEAAQTLNGNRVVGRCIT